jgi:clan AA aspartic protease
MGQFSVRVTVAHPADPVRAAELDLFVDTGATLSWVPREVVERLALPRLAARPFLLADGRTIERETAGAILRLDGAEANVTLVIGESGDGRLLGATALETLGFAVDPIHQRLLPKTLLAL